MDKEIIEAGSVIIARFMGEKVSTIGPVPMIKYGKYSKKPISEWAKYHSDWSWIMPVGKKIRSILEQIHEKMPKHSACHGDVIEVDIHCAIHEYDIEKAFMFMVQFIKWYNTQDKQK